MRHLVSYRLFEKGEAFLEEIIDLDYKDFVKMLSKSADDEELRKVILDGDDKVHVKDVTVRARDLVPTQQDISVSKCLKKLTSEKAEAIRSGEMPKGKPENMPVTLNGKYIMNGHHRWAQAYMVNPDCEIHAYDLRSDEEPLTMLKAMHLAVVAVSGDVRKDKGGGVNLFTIEKEAFRERVDKHLDPDIDEQEIWKNIRRLQEDNRPIEGAPKRKHMPQADKKGEWKDAIEDGVKLK